MLLASLGFETIAVEPSSAASAAVAEAGVSVLRAVVSSPLNRPPNSTAYPFEA